MRLSMRNPSAGLCRLGAPAETLRQPCTVRGHRLPLPPLCAARLFRPAACGRTFGSGRAAWRPALRSDARQTSSAASCAPVKGPEQPPKSRPPPPRPSPPSPPKAPKRRRTGVVGMAVVLAATAYWAGSATGLFSRSSGEAQGGAEGDDGSSRHRAGASLNETTFVPFEVVARESVSPTAFVLTLRLPRNASVASRAATRDAIARARAHGLWSVEVRQPQLQIAREYTPLPYVPAVVDVPDVPDTGRGDDADCELRLFIRTVPGGEVSRYLSQRVVGATVDVRGPRLSFDVGARRGARGAVVVLAGGTGIATALQAAATVLDGDATEPASSATVTILWANRLSQDSLRLDGSGDPALANPIVRDLRALQARYGARLRVHSFVDAQHAFITEGVVHRAIIGDGPYIGIWPLRWHMAAPSPAAASTTDPACVYHGARVLERLEADVLRHAPAAPRCSCGTSDAASGSEPSTAGKNLVLVSGPDGFIAAWAGAKSWSGGKERQGPVGGILAKMAARDPERFAHWQVLKL